LSSVLKIESAAVRLRHHLKTAPLPELKLLCGLRFFELFTPDCPVNAESYLREFVPTLASAAQKSNPKEFLPEEADSLKKLIDLLSDYNDNVMSGDDRAALSQLHDDIKAGKGVVRTAGTLPKNTVCVTCLFVEYNPDLDLPPRGRILSLQISAIPVSSVDADDIVVRNPISEPDDRFLTQARVSAAAARRYLNKRYGLSLKKRYRFDLSIESTGARFTGDSLGVAFAVGVIAILAKVEVFREKLSVPSQVAFSGALSSEGKLAPVDAGALRLKIYRAFHSDLDLLVIPRQHLTDAWTYLTELESRYPDRKLELVGAERLEAVVADPRLVPAERSSSPMYWGRWLWKTRRSVWVEVPVLAILLIILVYLAFPAKYLPGFDHNPAYTRVNVSGNCLEVYNRDDQLLWSETSSCNVTDTFCGRVYDFNGDGFNEVLWMPQSSENCEERGTLYYYAYDGTTIFRRFGGILGKYHKDTAGVLYTPLSLDIATVAGEPVVITQVSQEVPARMHIRLWSADGDSLGWYINWGHCMFGFARDLDGDGREELLFMGINNPMNCVVMFALKADSCYGFSPPYRDSPEHSGLEPGSQYRYVLFPVTDVGRIDMPTSYNLPDAYGLREEETGLLTASVVENISRDAVIIYTLDSALRVVKAVCNDRFIKRRDELVASGELPAMSREEYQARLRDAVTYWTDSGWVTEGQLRAVESRR
jgi:hypothetical protein